jgi:hypothetical protein
VNVPDEPLPPGDVITVEVGLSQDRGFVRRACPHCEREFKRLGERVKESEEAAEFICCYCYENAPRDAWWTPAQQAYFQAVLYREAVAPKLRALKDSLDGMETGGLLNLSFDVTGIEKAPPIAPEESASMTRVEFPCHPEEPLRVAEDWEFDVACTVCGTRYPVADVQRADPAS